ncbi:MULTISPECIES: hypothetical protein [Cupriavidus]
MNGIQYAAIAAAGSASETEMEAEAESEAGNTLWAVMAGLVEVALR